MTKEFRSVNQRFIANGDVSLSVAEYGDEASPAVILIHGISNRADGWLTVIPALAESFRVLAMDLRGHGQSGHPASGYRHADYAADLQAVIEAYRLPAPLIVGHSLGGMVALHWATEHPDVAAALVIEESPLSVGPGAEATFAAWLSLSGMSLETVLATYRAEQPHLPPEQIQRRAESMAETAPAVFHEELATARAGFDTDHIGPLAVIRSPVLLVHGDLEAGGMVPLSDARQFAGTVPRSRVERLAGGSHHLHRDRSDAFLRLVIPFLREHAGGNQPGT